jgi:hypothetical protein
MSDEASVKGWETDRARERPSRDELNALYHQYADEGQRSSTVTPSTCGSGTRPLEPSASWKHQQS